MFELEAPKLDATSPDLRNINIIKYIYVVYIILEHFLVIFK